MFIRNLLLIGVFAVLILVALFGRNSYVKSATDPAKKKQTITVNELNNRFIVLGAFKRPIGELFRITGFLKDARAKPGLILQIESVNGMPYDAQASTYLFDKLPTRKKGGRMSFSARSTLDYWMESIGGQEKGYYTSFVFVEDLTSRSNERP